MATSFTQIGRIALSRLGDHTQITSLDDAAKAAVILKENYELALDVCLRSHDWNFAKKRVVLAPLSTPPAFGVGNYFALPADWLRTLVDPEYPDLDFSMEGDGIRYDGTAFNLFYIARITDPNKFDALFIDAYAYLLASYIAVGLAQSNSKRESMYQAHVETLELAKSVSSQEQGPQQFYSDDFLNSRY